MGFRDKIKRMLKSDETIDKSTADKIKTSKSPQNFRYLDDLIHSGAKEITLTSDIVLGRDEKKRHYHGIKVDVDGLTIDGAGHSIDGGRAVKIFQCRAENITIKNITLKNGYSNSLGAGIENLKELKVINVSFKSNRDELSSG